jgi:superfamily II DNA/RNA helicase
MPPPIKKLADKFLTNPKYIEVSRPASNNTNIVQHKVMVASRAKRDMLRHLLRTDNVSTAIVFCNRKTTVRELAKHLSQSGFSAGEIHGDMDQSSRIAELDRFKDGKINILCASDVAARGLDVKGVSHVFNFDTPWHPDDYVHRIGRTGRAGATGRAFTFVAPEDAEAIDNVEKLTGGKIPVYTMGSGSEVVAAAPAGDASASEAKPRRDRNVKATRDAEPAKEPRAPRAARTPREEREPRPERAPREERAPRPERAPRAERKTPAAKQADVVDEAEGWNGPMPSFLSISAI